MTMDHASPARYQLVTDASADATWISMVHGVSQDHRVFDRQVDAFRRKFRIILIDLPGHGLSSELSGPYGLQEFASSISGALDQAGVTPSHFWGTHLGAAQGFSWPAMNRIDFHLSSWKGRSFRAAAFPQLQQCWRKFQIWRSRKAWMQPAKSGGGKAVGSMSSVRGLKNVVLRRTEQLSMTSRGNPGWIPASHRGRSHR